MNATELNNELENIDIYLLDQVLKNRFKPTGKILDAGCGSGRNIHYFAKNGFDISGIDSDENRIKTLQKKYSSQKFKVAKVEEMPFVNASFNYIICNAVLHFATNKTHFLTLFSELFRVLKSKGTLFVRMTSNFGIEHLVNEIKDGVYKIPDSTTRFLLTKNLLEQLKSTYNFEFIEPLKTVNVNNIRCMTTLIIKKL